jgi:organic hydroperoxide reductase OsmC/OhrA
MSNPDKAVVLYTAETDTTGGRDGASRSSDGRLAVKLSRPGSRCLSSECFGPRFYRSRRPI